MTMSLHVSGQKIVFVHPNGVFPEMLVPQDAIKWPDHPKDHSIETDGFGVPHFRKPLRC